MKLELWNGLLWQTINKVAFAYCPEHRIRLEIIDDSDDEAMPQDTNVASYHRCLLCPTDNREFPVPDRSFWILRRRYVAAVESLNLKDAEIVSIDGYQIPIAKAVTPEKDDEYWAEVRINDTKRGKQLVVYAGKRGAHEKAQIFIDPENDKITFYQNNIHPNDIFTKLVADFDTGLRTTMESQPE